VTEPDFETTEGDSQELYDKLISGDSMMSGWTPMVPEVWKSEWLDLILIGLL
jgi:hypothetical protein